MKEFRLNYSSTGGGGPGEDRLSSGSDQIEIGTSLHTFSEETKRHFFRMNLADFGPLWLDEPVDANRYADYKKEKSILVINDPHSNVTGQFRLFKGLEIFFRDNPDLIKKTAFLVEGYPSGQKISTQSLIDKERKPSDELIRNVLESFVISGYMAYEWKHQRGIPILGIEDPSLYELGRKYILLLREKPEELFYEGPIKGMEEVVREAIPSLWQEWQKVKMGSTQKGINGAVERWGVSVILADELVWQITNSAMSNFFLVARNQKMAETVVQNSEKYGNPMLFIGATHLVNLDDGDFTFEVIRRLISDPALRGSIRGNAVTSSINAINKGIYHYLKRKEIGFTLLDPEKLGDSHDADGYRKRFLTQIDKDKGMT